MVIISKHDFENAARKGVTCIDVLHPWTNSCILACLNLGCHVGYGSARFFAIVYTLQAVLNYKKINKDYVKKKIAAFCRSMLYGATYASLFLGYVCLTRKFTDGFKYYNLVFMSGICGGLSIFIESSENRLLDTVIYSNLVAETLFRWLDYKDIVTRNKLRDTLSFMTLSSVLMYLIKTQNPANKTTNIWFYYPPRLQTGLPKITRNCYHKEDCTSYLIKGTFRYFLLGYAIQLAKIVVPRMHKLILKPSKLLEISLSRKTISMGMFLGSYVGIFRLASCILFRNRREERAEHAIIAGFLAGTCYSLKPSLSVAAIALTTIFQMSIQRVPKFNDLNQKYPTKELLFALCSGILFHIRFLHPECCPRYVINMFDIGTNGKVPEVYENVLKFVGLDNIMPLIV